MAGRASGAPDMTKGTVPFVMTRGTGLPVMCVSTFVDEEGGYTTVAMACALLLSLTLAFGVASTGWVLSRSADVQEVADAAALSGANAVAAFSTIAQVLDACVLSLGLTGVIVSGAALVVSAVPGASSAGAEMMGLARDILDMRRGFARDAARGLERLEGALPALIAANSASCVGANARAGISYAGFAVPFPPQSLSSYELESEELDADSLEDAAHQLQDASDEVHAHAEAAREALERGWRADCGNPGFSMWQRAGTLSGISAAQNPHYPKPDQWNFGVALSRARVYYAARHAQEAPEGEGIEALTDSCCRSAFYRWASSAVNAAHYQEAADGSVSMDLPDLPHNVAEVRATALLTEVVWPCTAGEGGRMLHSTASCPGATGSPAGLASLAEQEAGGVGHCEVCRMDVGDMGKVAAASTSIENGFEHWWRELVAASRDYQAARNAQAEAEAKAQGLAEDGAGAFEQALAALSAPRPKICPPGAWGCVAAVARPESLSVPDEFTRSFLAGAELPAGAAISAATLAADDATRESNLLASFLDGLGSRGLAGLADGVASLWGRLLIAYGSAYDSASGAAHDALSTLEGVGASRIASWLRGKLVAIVEAADLEPADMRLKKPVLANSQDVLDKAGFSGTGKARALIESIPASADPAELAQGLASALADMLEGGQLVIAELGIPGTDLSIPLSIDVAQLAGALGSSP